MTIKPFFQGWSIWKWDNNCHLISYFILLKIIMITTIKKIKILNLECLSWQVLNISCETCVTFKYSYLVKFRLAMSHDCLECWPTHLRSRTHPGRNIPQRYFYREIIKKIYILKGSSNSLYQQGIFYFFTGKSMRGTKMSCSFF